MSGFELVVLGGGTGSIVASVAAEKGPDVAPSGIRRAGASTSPASRSRQCSDTDRLLGPFLPVDRPGPGGLKGRGTFDGPGRRKHHREQRDRGAQRVPGVERAEGFLNSAICI